MDSILNRGLNPKLLTRCGELKAKVLELEKEIVEGDVGSTREIEALKVALGRANEETKELEAKLCAAEVEIVQVRFWISPCRGQSAEH